MMIRLFLTGCICLLLSVSAYGVQPAGEESGPTLIVDNDTWIDANRLLMFVTNTGSIAYDRTALLGKADGLYFPFTTVDDILDGSNDNSVIYASGLWVGALDAATSDTLICLAEYSDEYSPGNMVSGGPNPNPQYPELKVYKLYSDSMALNPNQDYFDYLTFAVPQGAPLNSQGEPDIIGDQFLWCVYNDADPGAHNDNAGNTAPIGLEVRQSVYAFDWADELGQVTYVRYRIYNKGLRNLTNMYISLWSDPDLGGAGDDLVGCDTLTSVGYCYNATNSDADYGANPPCVGYDLLQGPLQFTGNSADTGSMWGARYPGYQNLALGSFNKYINGTDPNSYRETYQYMAGLDASQGGTPLPNGTRFAVPGDPVTATGDLDSNPSDRRFMLSNQPIDLAAGDSTEVIFAILVGQGADRLSSISVMRTVDEMAQEMFDNGLTAPAISVSTNLIDFGTILLGGSGVDSFFISNAGNATLSITDIASDQPVFAVDGSAFDLLPGESQAIPISFTPDDVGNHGAVLTISSNDSEAPVTWVILVGQSFLPPDISISPLSLSSSLLTGESEDHILTITNNGAGDLSYNINTGALGAASQLLKEFSIINQAAETTVAEPMRYDEAETFRDMYLSYDATSAEKPVYPRPDQSVAKYGSDWSALMASLAADSTSLFFDDMETVGGWTHYSTHSNLVDYWEHSTTRANSGLSSWHVSQHDSYGSEALQSPAIDLSLTQTATLAFMHWYEFDDCSDPMFDPDGGIVEISDDGGASWTQIHPTEGYPYVLDDICDNPLAFQPAYSHNSSGFVPAVFDLTPFVGNVVLLRFHAGWDCGNCDSNDGWYIDDVTVFAGDYFGWLTTDLSEGTLPPASSVDVTATLDAFGLIGGEYDAAIRVSSNDPDQPSIDIPAHLSVTGAPDIQLSAALLDFDNVFIGLTATDTVTISNVGTDVLNITAISTGLPEFTASPAVFSLTPAESQDVIVQFSPVVAGLFTTGLTILSNDADEPSVVVNLSGRGLVPPEIAISPDSIGVGLFTGETATRFLTVSNNGGSDLALDLSVELANGNAELSTANIPRLLKRLEPALKSTNYLADDLKDRSTKTMSLFTDPTLNDLPSKSGAAVSEVAGLYDGTHLSFGITDYGEIMPFQFPIGNEHLQNGAYVSGYTIAYDDAGTDKIAYAAFESRSGLLPILFTELVNTATSVIVEVVTQTSDGALRITRTFSFDPSDKYINVQTNLENISAGLVTAVVFKSFADWDNDGDPGDDNWDYDLSRNMIFAWDVNYTAIAASQAPDLMDLFGWDDFTRRETFVDFSSGPVLLLDGLEVLHFELGSLFAGEVTELETVFAAGTDLPDLQAAVDRGIRLINWIEVNPEEAIIASGTSQDFAIAFDATGLYGGDYFATLLVESNDIETPELQVPLYMQVTGVPDILVSPGSIDFGTLFLSLSATDSFMVANIGTDQLTVTSISSDNADYQVDATSFELAPGETQVVNVFFTPSQTGLRNGTLTIASNDPDQPEISVDLSGVGMEPPIIGLTPGSFDEHLIQSMSQSIDRTLTVYNTGGSDLNWDMAAFEPSFSGKQTFVLPPLDIETQEPDEAGPQVPTGAAWSQTEPLVADMLDLTGIKVLVDQYHGSISFSGWSSIISDLQARGATIDQTFSPTTSATLSDYDVLWLGEQYTTWSPSEQTALVAWLNSGKGLLIEGDNNSTVGILNPLLSFIGSGIQYSTVNGFNGTTGNIHPHETTVGVNSIYLSANISHLQTIVPPGGVLVTDVGGRHNTAYSNVGNGRVIVMSDEITIDSHIGYADNRLFGNQVFDWLSASVNWLSLLPESGVLPQSGSTDVTVHFDSEGLEGGDYFATIRVSSNDPATTQLEVPVHLRVDPYICGDANLDGIVNIQDLDLVRSYYFICGASPQPFEASDVDCDGQVGLADIMALARHIYQTGILNCCY